MHFRRTLVLLAAAAAATVPLVAATPASAAVSARVFGTEGVGLNVRPAPSTAGAVLANVAENTYVSVSCQTAGHHRQRHRRLGLPPDLPRLRLRRLPVDRVRRLLPAAAALQHHPAAGDRSAVPDRVDRVGRGRERPPGQVRRLAGLGVVLDLRHLGLAAGRGEHRQPAVHRRRLLLGSGPRPRLLGHVRGPSRGCRPLRHRPAGFRHQHPHRRGRRPPPRPRADQRSRATTATGWPGSTRATRGAARPRSTGTSAPPPDPPRPGRCPGRASGPGRDRPACASTSRTASEPIRRCPAEVEAPTAYDIARGGATPRVLRPASRLRRVPLCPWALTDPVSAFYRRMTSCPVGGRGRPALRDGGRSHDDTGIAAAVEGDQGGGRDGAAGRGRRHAGHRRGRRGPGPAGGVHPGLEQRLRRPGQHRRGHRCLAVRHRPGQQLRHGARSRR